MEAFPFRKALCQPLSHLKKLSEPGNAGTFFFSPYKIFLLASSDDGKVMGELAFQGTISNRSSHSVGVNLEQLLAILDVAEDDDSIQITPNVELSQFIIRIRKSIVYRYRQTFGNVEFIPPNPMHVALKSREFVYEARSQVSSATFTDYISRIGSFYAFNGNGIVATNKGVQISIGPFKKYLSIKDEECTVIGIGEDDDGSYLAEFNFQSLISLEESILMSTDILIYHTLRDDLPHALESHLDSGASLTYFFQ